MPIPGRLSRLLFAGAMLCGSKVCSQAPKYAPDLPFLNTGHRLTSELAWSSAVGAADTVSLRFYIYSNRGDSILLCRRDNAPVPVRSRPSSLPISFAAKDPKESFVLPVFAAILQKTGNLPAGHYKAFLALASEGNVYRSYTFAVDSALPATSPLRRSLARAAAPTKPGGFTTAASALKRNSRQIGRMVQAKGLTQQRTQSADKEIINLWYEDWFVGRYELEGSGSITAQLARHKAEAAGNVSSLANNELEGYRSLRSQVRDLLKQRKEEKETGGEIGLSAAWATAQPEYSTQDNNYYELRGDFETELLGMPVGIETFYTTQDAHRRVKSSYIRLHYDAEKAKAGLLKLIGGFKQQYGNTAAKGKGLDQVYGSYVSGLTGNKSSLLNGLKSESGYAFDNGPVDEAALKASIKKTLEARMRDTAAALKGAGDEADSTGRAEAAAARAKAVTDSAERLYAKAMARYAQAQELQKKADKYTALLDQYRNTVYFDSALAYAKVQDLENAEELSYKDLAKRASGLLPEGKAKTFAAGLTSLEAGIFPKYVSKYTMAGQQVKGLDAGYDVGLAEIGFTAGRTEYAGRGGSLDKYTTYGGRAMFKPAKNQKAGLVYYGYTPSRSAFSSDKDFYKNINIAIPTFREPVHIVSAVYEGVIARRVRLDGEAATSYRKGRSAGFASGFDADRLAWHLNAEGDIPKSTLTLTGSYEHGGKEFQNSTLPLFIRGTDLYNAGIKGRFFHGFLTGGITFNHMVQHTFYTRGGNSRWGFEVATHSKQYPSLALSYKPFATFRADADTFSVPQRQLSGAVWSGKGSYQVKRNGGRVWRFSTVYNKSRSTSDSLHYSSSLLQVNIIYRDKKWMITGSGGQSSMQTRGIPASDSLNPAHIRTTFGMGGVGYALSKRLHVSGGGDIGFAPFGLSKYGLNGGVNYRLKKAPLTVRTYARYGAYRLPRYSGATRPDASTDRINNNGSNEPPLSWQRMLSGGLDLVWQFKLVNGE